MAKILFAVLLAVIKTLTASLSQLYYWLSTTQHYRTKLEWGAPQIETGCHFCGEYGFWKVGLYPNKFAAVTRPMSWGAVFPVKRMIGLRMTVACPECWRPKYDREGKLEDSQ